MEQGKQEPTSTNGLTDRSSGGKIIGASIAACASPGGGTHSVLLRDTLRPLTVCLIHYDLDAGLIAWAPAGGRGP